MAKAYVEKTTPSAFLNKYVNILPGITLCLVIAVIAHHLGQRFPVVGGAVFAIIMGITLKNTVGIPARVTPGISFTSKKILKGAIIVLGVGLSLTQVVKTGMDSLSVMLCTLTAAYASAFLFGKLMGIPENLKHLIGTGTAICGASAIAAISPIVEADDSEIAYSISTVFFFNVLAVLIFPFLGHLLVLSDSTFGLWAGTAINDTSSVVAAGYIYSDPAGAYATIVKLTRTTMIIPIALLYIAAAAKKKKAECKTTGTKCDIKKIIPWFIFLFLAAALLNTLGLFSDPVIQGANWLGKFLIVMALAAVGLQANLRQMLGTGIRPIALGMIVWFVVSVTSLIVQHFVLGQL